MGRWKEDVVKSSALEALVQVAECDGDEVTRLYVCGLLARLEMGDRYVDREFVREECLKLGVVLK